MNSINSSYAWEKIGKVDVVKLFGNLSQPRFASIEEAMSQRLKEDSPEAFLFDLRDVKALDSLTASSVEKVIRHSTKSAILGRNPSSYLIAKKLQSLASTPIFERECEAIHYFGRELAKSEEGFLEERRHFPRIKTVIPGRFEIKSERQSFPFGGMVTNLSEGGLYAKFFHTLCEVPMANLLDPFDLKMLGIHLDLDPIGRVEARGKILRIEKENQRLKEFGVELYNLDLKARKKIQRFLEQNLILNDEEEKTT